MNRKTIFTLIILAILIIAIPVTLTLVKKQQQLKSKAEELTRPAGAIAKVGAEYIYQTDLDKELAAYPLSAAASAEVRDKLLQKLVEDSIILQGAASDHLISLNSSVYNSETKDFQRRFQLVAQAKTYVEDKVDTITAATVSIWFNNNTPPSLWNNQERKQTAFDKISHLQQEVKSGRMTIQQAGEAVENDTSLADIDPNGYKSNAYTENTVPKGEKLAFDSGYDAILKNLNVGEISDVFLFKDSFAGARGIPAQQVDAAYMFGQVLEKASHTIADNFDDWLEVQRGKYEATIY